MASQAKGIAPLNIRSAAVSPAASALGMRVSGYPGASERRLIASSFSEIVCRYQVLIMPQSLDDFAIGNVLV